MSKRLSSEASTEEKKESIKKIKYEQSDDQRLLKKDEISGYNVMLVTTDLTIFMSEGLLSEQSEFFNALFKSRMVESQEKKYIFDENKEPFNTTENVVIMIKLLRHTIQMNEYIALTSLEFFNFYQFDGFTEKAIKILNKAKLSLADIARVLILSDISPHKEKLLETVYISLKEAAQVGHTQRNITKEINDLSATYPPETCRRVIAGLAVEQQKLLIEYHRNVLEILNTQIPSRSYEQPKSLYSSLENLCPNFKTFVTKYFHFGNV
jgi:hypothetical protein